MPKKEAVEAVPAGSPAPSPTKKQRLDVPAGKPRTQAAAPGAPPSESSATASGAANSPSEGPAAAASGAPPELSVAVYEMLRLEDLQAHTDYLTRWATEVKTYVDKELPTFLSSRQEHITFNIPSNLAMLAPLEIGNAANQEDNALSAFREVMHYEHLMTSFKRTGQYEAAGTIWMLEPIESASGDGVTVGQLESAMALFSEQAFIRSSTTPSLRRYSFDVSLPAAVENTQIVQRLSVGSGQVAMAHPLPILAGRAQVIAWYSAVAHSLKGKDISRVMKLFEAALSVPIRLRLDPDADSRQLASLQFSEVASATAAASGADIFWNFAEKINRLGEFRTGLAQSASLPKLNGILKKYGVSFKGKAVTEASAKALKCLAPFVCDSQCRLAYSLVDMFCPELREATLLMRIAQLSAVRAPCAAGGSASASGGTDGSVSASGGVNALKFIFDCLRVARLQVCGVQPG